MRSSSTFLPALATWIAVSHLSLAQAQTAPMPPAASGPPAAESSPPSVVPPGAAPSDAGVQQPPAQPPQLQLNDEGFRDPSPADQDVSARDPNAPVSPVPPPGPVQLNDEGFRDSSPADQDDEKEEKEEKKIEDQAWYERLKVRGYTQFRYNQIPTFNDNEQLVNSQGDRNLNYGNGFSIRRARVILYGDIHERVYVYLQTDFASVIDQQGGVAIVRDWYTDLFLTKSKTLRARVGMSKVPFGFVNMQSSQNRLPFDRDDAVNSAARDERDLGIFLYWATKEHRERYKYLVDSGLKGSGDYGSLALGVYNGQGLNRPALSNDMHVIGRINWPFKFGEQFVEVGASGYYGKYYVSTNDPETYQLDVGKIKDARANFSFVYYPQPFGIQGEFVGGVGPSLGDLDAPDHFVITQRPLWGGYLQVMWKFDKPFHTVAIIPYVRGQYYDGGKKFDVNAPHFLIRELDIGIEWQIFKPLELTLEYDLDDRTTSKEPYSQEKGHFFRAQLQVNY